MHEQRTRPQLLPARTCAHVSAIQRMRLGVNDDQKAAIDSQVVKPAPAQGRGRAKRSRRLAGDGGRQRGRPWVSCSDRGSTAAPTYLPEPGTLSTVSTVALAGCCSSRGEAAAVARQQASRSAGSSWAAAMCLGLLPLAGKGSGGGTQPQL